MILDWDKNKRKINLDQHDVDFEAAYLFEWESAIIRSDSRKEYGEQRMIGFAPIGERLYCIVFTVRGECIRIISLRKANRREVTRYEKETDLTD
jgi:uncharacterized protein